MIGTLVAKYHGYRTLENCGNDDDVTHQAAMAAIDARMDIEDRVNRLLEKEGVTLAQIMKVMTL